MRATLLLLILVLVAGMVWLLFGSDRADESDQDARSSAEIVLAVPAGADAATDEAELRRSTMEPETAGNSAVAGFPIRAGVILFVVNESGEPIPDARVRAALVEESWPGQQPECDWSSPALQLLAETRSDAHGRAELSTLPECTRVLIAAEARAYTRAQQFVLTPDAKHSLDLGVWTLEPAPPVTLRFADRSGAPAADLDFLLWSNDAESGRRDDSIEGRTDAHGIAIIECFPMVSANVSMLHFGRYLFEPIEDVLAPGQRAAEVIVDAGEQASGRLLEDDGDPVAGATIMLFPTIMDFQIPEGELFTPWDGPSSTFYDDSRGFRDFAVTDAEGAFQVSGIPRNGSPIVLLARIEPGQWFSGKWTKQREGIEVRIPVRHYVRGTLRGPFDAATAVLHLEREFRRPSDPEQRDVVMRYHLDDLRLPLAPDGRFELLLPEATYRIGVEYPGGYAELEAELALTQATDLGLREIAEGASLIVSWPDAPSDTDASPRLRRAASEGAQDPWEAPLRTQAVRISSKEWKFLGLAPGDYRVSLDGSRIEPIAGQITLATSEQGQLALTPRASGTIVIELLGQDPAAFEGRTVTLMAQPDVDVERAALLQDLDPQHPESKHLVALDGRARALDLPAGRYLVSLDAPEGVDNSWWEDGEPLGEVELEAGGRAVLAVETGRFGTVRFVVLDKGRPVEGAGIAYALLDEDGVLRGDVDPWLAPGTTSEDGSWTATGVAPGRYLAVANLDDDSARNECEFEVVSGENLVTIELAQNTMRGRVLDAAGAGAVADVLLWAESMWFREEGMGARVEDASLETARHKLTIGSCTTDEQGGFQFVHVPPGRYRLCATSADEAIVVGPWFVVQDSGEVTLEALTLQPWRECKWTIRGLDAWNDVSVELRFRSASSGEIWRTHYFFNRRRTLAEETLRLHLPDGEWHVEGLGSFDHELGVITTLTIHDSSTLPDFVLPPPSQFGIEPH